MQKTLTAIVLMFGLSAATAPTSFGQVAQARRMDETTKSCQNLFGANKSSIERLAQAGNKEGIRSLYIRAGCMAPGISIAKAPSEKAININCTITFNPTTITCTFGALSKQVGSAVD